MTYSVLEGLWFLLRLEEQLLTWWQSLDISGSQAAWLSLLVLHEKLCLKASACNVKCIHVMSPTELTPLLSSLHNKQQIQNVTSIKKRSQWPSHNDAVVFGSTCCTERPHVSQTSCEKTSYMLPCTYYFLKREQIYQSIL